MAVEVEVEEMEEVEDEVTEVEVQGQVKVRVRTNILATRRPDMLTCPHSQPAGATGPMGKVLTIVKNPQPVPGKTFGFPNQIWNEVPTSSIIRMTTDRYIICCTEMTWK